MNRKHFSAWLIAQVIALIGVTSLWRGKRNMRVGAAAVLVFVLVAGVALRGGAWWTEAAQAKSNGSDEAAVKAAFEKLPLSFEPNAGQADPAVRFTAHAPGGTMFFTQSGVVLVLEGSTPAEQGTSEQAGGGQSGRIAGLAAPAPPEAQATQASVVRMTFEGASGDVQVAPGAKQRGTVSYFSGNESSKWRAGLPTYAGIEYTQLYPGITLSYGGSGGRLKGTYTVEAGADPSAIRWSYEGVERLWVDEAGNLMGTLGAENVSNGAEAATVSEQAPVAWQVIAGEQVEVEVRYSMLPGRTVEFTVGGYDPTYPLIIDPTLTYSTYLGGRSTDVGRGIAVDAGGNMYVTGLTLSSDFPVANPFQPVLNCNEEVFITKLNPQGSALIYSTYLGGRDYDHGREIAVDGSGSAYIVGDSGSLDFPQVNALQPAYGGGWDDAFITKLSPNGSALVYSTYLGGSGADTGSDVTVDAGGSAYITGHTQSLDFPVANPFQPVSGGFSDAYITKLSPDGSALVYSTYLGGSGGDAGAGITVDGSGSAYVIGHTGSLNFPLANAYQSEPGGLHEVFITKLDASGSALVFSTYLGGSDNDHSGGSIAVDSSGSTYVTGHTRSHNFPLANPFQPMHAGNVDLFVTKLSPNGSALVYSTYLGGSNIDYGESVAVDSSGSAYLMGSTNSSNFPVASPFQAQLGGSIDAFVTKLSPTGSALVYSSYLGGRGFEYARDLAIDSSGTAYVIGETGSRNFPVVNPFQGRFKGVTDAFVSKIAHAR